jgi:hypothetical protein
MAFSTNPVSQPSLDISANCIPLLAMSLPTHRGDQYDVTDSSWISIKF